jgi:phosphoadenosine phosphosulfate reductase
MSGAVTTVIDRRRGSAPRAFDLLGDRPAVASIDVEAGARLAGLLQAARGRDATGIVELALREAFAGETAIVSSFGAESVVLLHLVAQVDPATPILFLNTGKLFGETLRYRDRLQDVLGLTDIRSLAPHPADRARLDPEGTLWSRDTDACCGFRKVVPLRHALDGFAAHITGRKRFQTNARARMERVEYFEGRFRFNPLCDWTLRDIEAYAAEHNLPRHPLVEDGYPSIGCLPCTRRIQSGEAYRDGRWAGLDKDECGIHAGLDGEGI